MCKYCNTDEDAHYLDEDTLLFNFSYDMGLAGTLTVMSFMQTATKFGLLVSGAEDDVDERHLGFKYCPMCGRKLEELDG